MATTFLEPGGDAENIILKERKDLAIIGCDKPIPLYSKDGLELEMKNMHGELFVEMIIDGRPNVMSTRKEEHLLTEKDVEECPENARVFIGGLGFGMVLLYLAESKKAKEVIVCEIDQRVIDKFGETITNYLKENYPDFNLKIIKGDAWEEVKNHDLFDWIYMDTNLDDITKDYQAFRVFAKSLLTVGGRQTHFGEIELT